MRTHMQTTIVDEFVTAIDNKKLIRENILHSLVVLAITAIVRLCSPLSEVGKHLCTRFASRWWAESPSEGSYAYEFESKTHLQPQVRVLVATPARRRRAPIMQANESNHQNKSVSARIGFDIVGEVMTPS